MVYLVYKEENDNGDIMYNYYPEKMSNAPGIVAINRYTGKRILIKESPYEKDGVKWYRFHAWRGIEKMLKDGVMSEEFCIMWY